MNVVQWMSIATSVVGSTIVITVIAVGVTSSRNSNLPPCQLRLHDAGLLALCLKECECWIPANYTEAMVAYVLEQGSAVSPLVVIVNIRCHTETALTTTSTMIPLKRDHTGNYTKTLDENFQGEGECPLKEVVIEDCPDMPLMMTDDLVGVPIRAIACTNQKCCACGGSEEFERDSLNVDPPIIVWFESHQRGEATQSLNSEFEYAILENSGEVSTWQQDAQTLPGSVDSISGHQTQILFVKMPKTADARVLKWKIENTESLTIYLGRAQKLCAVQPVEIAATTEADAGKTFTIEITDACCPAIPLMPLPVGMGRIVKVFISSGGPVESITFTFFKDAIDEEQRRIVGVPLTATQEAGEDAEFGIADSHEKMAVVVQGFKTPTTIVIEVAPTKKS